MVTEAQGSVRSIGEFPPEPGSWGRVIEFEHKLVVCLLPGVLAPAATLG